MEDFNYKLALTNLEESIVKQTLNDNYDTSELLKAQLNTIFGLVSIFEGELSDIFPICSPERAQKFMIYVHSISAFQFASSIFDMLFKGQYTEADALTRSLIETVAFSEFYKFNPDIAFQSIRHVENLPLRTTVFRFLAKNGNWPSGGPQKAFERHNNAAHGNITSVTNHWMESGGKPQVTEIWIRRYSSKSFLDIARDQIIPLLGIQQIFRDIFIDDDKITNRTTWMKYWRVGHNRKLNNEIIPRDCNTLKKVSYKTHLTMADKCVRYTPFQSHIRIS